MLQDKEQLEQVIDQHVGKRLKHRRLFLGLTRQNLADAIGVSIQQVHKYETAANRISSSKLYNVATFLKVPVNYFFERMELAGLVSSSSLAEEADEYEAQHISEREVSKLVQNYVRIKSNHLRKGVLDLLNAMSTQEFNNSNLEDLHDSQVEDFS